MHVQEIQVLNISKQIDSSFASERVTTYRNVPGISVVDTYSSPIVDKSLRDKDNQGGCSAFRENNSIGEYYVIPGKDDVDYVYKMYVEHPDWFNGSTREAYVNRDAVINLTYNLLGKDWYSLFKCATVDKRIGINIHVINMLRDIIRYIGICRPGEEPRYTIPFHMGLVSDSLVGELNPDVNYSGTHPCYVRQLNQKEFDEIFFGQPNPENTTDFIRKAMIKGGIGLLITLLNAMYGSLIVKSDRFRFS